MDCALPQPAAAWALTLRPEASRRGARLSIGRPARLAVSAALHAAALAAVCAIVVPPLPPPAPTQAVAVVFAAPQAAPALSEIGTAALSPPSAMELPQALAPIPPLTVAPAAEHALAIYHRPQPVPPSRQAARHDGARSTPAASQTLPGQGTIDSPAATPPAAQGPDPASLDRLEASIRQSVQNAAVYPAAARMQHREGRARVAFTYSDGAVSSVALAASSGSSMLDAAALDAVRRAFMPRAPSAIGRRMLSLLVWVRFGLVAAGDG
jgi:protein TonB